MSTTLPPAALLDLMHLLLLQHTAILSKSANCSKPAYLVLLLQRHKTVTSKVQEVLQNVFNVQTLAMASPGMQDCNSWDAIVYCYSGEHAAHLPLALERQHTMATLVTLSANIP
jgi:ATP-dependent Clp protease adapter protein ClpS